MKNINLFSTQSDYESATLTYPNLSFVTESNNVYSVLTWKYNMVDLGLPSGTLWMDRNLGASSPTDTGLFFLWGDTVGSSESEGSCTECPGNGGSSTFNETSLMAWDNEHTTNYVLNNDVDAAYVHTNGKAKIPTKEQIEELFENTSVSYIQENNMLLVKFENKSDSSKFILIPSSHTLFFMRSSVRTEDDITSIHSLMIMWDLKITMWDTSYRSHRLFIRGVSR